MILNRRFSQQCSGQNLRHWTTAIVDDLGLAEANMIWRMALHSCLTYQVWPRMQRQCWYYHWNGWMVDCICCPMRIAWRFWIQLGSQRDLVVRSYLSPIVQHCRPQLLASTGPSRTYRSPLDLQCCATSRFGLNAIGSGSSIASSCIALEHPTASWARIWSRT